MRNICIEMHMDEKQGSISALIYIFGEGDTALHGVLHSKFSKFLSAKIILPPSRVLLYGQK